jgi:hypothetical protein
MSNSEQVEAQSNFDSMLINVRSTEQVIEQLRLIIEGQQKILEANNQDLYEYSRVLRDQFGVTPSFEFPDEFLPDLRDALSESVQNVIQELEEVI